MNFDPCLNGSMEPSIAGRWGGRGLCGLSRDSDSGEHDSRSRSAWLRTAPLLTTPLTPFSLKGCQNSLPQNQDRLLCLICQHVDRNPINWDCPFAPFLGETGTYYGPRLFCVELFWRCCQVHFGPEKERHVKIIGSGFLHH